MDVVFGFVGYDFALLVADRASVQQIIVQNSDEDKIVEIDATKMLALSGPKAIARRSGNIYERTCDCIDCNINTNWT